MIRRRDGKRIFSACNIHKALLRQLDRISQGRKRKGVFIKKADLLIRAAAPIGMTCVSFYECGEIYIIG